MWEAITTPEFTSRYCYGSTLKTDFTADSPFTYHMPDVAPIVEGRWLRPSRPPNEDAPTRVTWELESMPGGVTRVTVIHEDFQGEPATYKGVQSGGWTWFLSTLKTLLETGAPMPQQY